MPDMTGGFDLGETLFGGAAAKLLLNAVTRAYLRIWVPPWDSRRAAEPGSNTTRCFQHPALTTIRVGIAPPDTPAQQATCISRTRMHGRWASPTSPVRGGTMAGMNKQIMALLV